MSKTYPCQCQAEYGLVKHAPGPWKATHRGAGGWAISNTVWVEYLRSSGLTSADARLMAAAPDLLSALRLAREELHHPGAARTAHINIAEIIDAAIAKTA